MKAMYRKNAMNMFADACSAPATQSAAMTMSKSYSARMLDTAVKAVSFLFDVLLDLVCLAVRIILPDQAKP